MATGDRLKRSNAQWLEVLRRPQGDPERNQAVEELYHLLYVRAYHFCISDCHLAAEEARLIASDVAADKICLILEKQVLDAFRGDASISTYVTSWAPNAVRSHLRRLAYRRERGTRSLDAPADGEDGPTLDPPDPRRFEDEIWHISSTLQQAFEQCLSRVQAQNQTILWLRHVERMPGDEVAEEFGMTRNTIDLRSSRTAAAIRKCLEAKGFTRAVVLDELT